MWNPGKAKSIEGWTALVTGAGSKGLGREIAYELATQCKVARLLLWDINAQGLEDTVADLRQRSVKIPIESRVVNLADRAQIYAGAQAIAGAVDLVRF